MGAGSLPAIPIEEVDPEEAIVSFVQFECRTCGDRAPWVRDQGESRHYEWLFKHGEQHPKGFKYYSWSATRNTGRHNLLF